MSRKARRKARDPLGTLEVIQTQADVYRIQSRELKPCVAAMLNDGVPRGGALDPNSGCHIIACEFRRLGIEQDQAEEKLCEWQARTGGTLGYGEIKKTVRSAYGGEHIYACGLGGKLYNSGYCVSHETCTYYRAHGGGVREPRDLDFFEYGWPARLGSATSSVYVAITVIEKKRNHPGGKTLVTYRDLHRFSGASRGRMRDRLEELQAAGLLSFREGKPGSRHREATEIQRVLPIPEPPPR